MHRSGADDDGLGADRAIAIAGMSGNPAVASHQVEDDLAELFA